MSEQRKLRIILDTNILLISISKKSEFRWIFEKLISEEYDLFISNEILSEYEEILDQKTTPEIKKNIIDLLLTAENVHKTITYFNWNLISTDQDDNKFVDCAIASNADCIVTRDKHFDVLQAISFPKVKVITPEKLKELF
jgi:uncharacterized protein